MPTGQFDYQHGDLEVLNAYREQIRQVVGLIEEVFVTNRAALLSPVIREIVANAGAKLGKMHSQISVKLIVDNPGTPLKDQA